MRTSEKRNLVWAMNKEIKMLGPSITNHEISKVNKKQVYLQLSFLSVFDKEKDFHYYVKFFLLLAAISDTIDWRLPVNLLKSVDLPTLGLPTIATVGFIDVASWWFKLSVPLLGWIYPVLLTKYQSITLVTKEFCKNGFLCVKSVFSLMIYNRIGMFQHTI